MNFPTHALYTGQDTFFPLEVTNGARPYRLTLLPQNYDAPRYARTAFFGFLVSVAYLNTRPSEVEQNYSMLIHTSGKRVDHRADWYVFDRTVASLISRGGLQFDRYAKEIWEAASSRYGAELADKANQLRARQHFAVRNFCSEQRSGFHSERLVGNESIRPIYDHHRRQHRVPGVTFENLLAMFFTRDVKHRMQQDTYIQRARMFGSRGGYLPHFELTIPDHLYADWHRCFVFHRLALSAIQRELGSPVWLTDQRIAAAASSSIDRSTVDVDRGEMAFHLFDFDGRYDMIAASATGVVQKLTELAAAFGSTVFPDYLREFMVRTSPDPERAIAIHASSSISGYKEGRPR